MLYQPVLAGALIVAPSTGATVSCLMPLKWPALLGTLPRAAVGVIAAGAVCARSRRDHRVGHLGGAAGDVVPAGARGGADRGAEHRRHRVLLDAAEVAGAVGDVARRVGDGDRREALTGAVAEDVLRRRRRAA